MLPESICDEFDTVFAVPIILEVRRDLIRDEIGGSHVASENAVVKAGTWEESGTSSLDAWSR
jgi:hypothetical protein